MHTHLHQFYCKLQMYLIQFIFNNNNNGLAIVLIDYVGFIKKIMKLLQKGYNDIQALEVELRILEQTSAPPSRPRKLKDTKKNNQINTIEFCYYYCIRLIFETSSSISNHL